MIRGFQGALLVLLLTATASATVAPPSALVRAGPYLFRIEYLNEARGGQALEFRLKSENVPLDRVELHIRAIPGTNVDAVPVQATLQLNSLDKRSVIGKVNLPVRGLWVLDLYAKGPRGEGAANAPILAATPPVLPVWLGWLIGLIPVFAILGFVTIRAVRPTSLNVA